MIILIEAGLNCPNGVMVRDLEPDLWYNTPVHVGSWYCCSACPFCKQKLNDNRDNFFAVDCDARRE